MERLSARASPQPPNPLVSVSAGAGVAALKVAATPQDVFDAADRTLYRSKAAGRGLVRVDGDPAPDA